MNKTASLLALVTLLAFGCDDDRTPGGTDSGTVADSGTTTDSGATDSGTTADAGTPTCFPLSGPVGAGVPDAIPSEFTASSTTWMRPTGEECPATGLGAEAVPFETVCYINDTGADLGVTFEVLVGDEGTQPAAVLYDGATVPSDATQCAAVSSDLVIDAAEVYYTVAAGSTVTFVATLQDPDTGTFQFAITPDEE